MDPHRRGLPRIGSEHLFFLSLLVVVHALGHFLASRIGAFPAEHLDPLAHFQVFVMLKKVSDGFQAHRVQVLGLLPLGVDGQNLVGGNGQGGG